MEEIWKDVVGYEKYYEVSNTGYIRNKHTKRILNGNINKDGYRKVKLGYGTSKEYCYHRVVAIAFIPNPQNKPEINHIDNNRLNNRVDNLEWVTHEENVKWCAIQGRKKVTEEIRQNMIKSQSKRAKPVIGTDENGNKHYFEKLKDVREKGFNPLYVSLCCSGRQEKYKGWTFEFSPEVANRPKAQKLKLTDEEWLQHHEKDMQRRKEYRKEYYKRKKAKLQNEQIALFDYKAVGIGVRQ